MEEVLLVDEQDRVLGIRRSCRRTRWRQAAPSLLDPDLRPLRPELLQLRSRQKYHFGGLWTNQMRIRTGARPASPNHAFAEDLGFDNRLRSSRLSTVWQTLGAA